MKVSEVITDVRRQLDLPSHATVYVHKHYASYGFGGESLAVKWRVSIVDLACEVSCSAAEHEFMYEAAQAAIEAWRSEH